MLAFWDDEGYIYLMHCELFGINDLDELDSGHHWRLLAEASWDAKLALTTNGHTDDTHIQTLGLGVLAAGEAHGLLAHGLTLSRGVGDGDVDLAAILCLDALTEAEVLVGEAVRERLALKGWLGLLLLWLSSLRLGVLLLCRLGLGSGLGGGYRSGLLLGLGGLLRSGGLGSGCGGLGSRRGGLGSTSGLVGLGRGLRCHELGLLGDFDELGGLGLALLGLDFLLAILFLFTVFFRISAILVRVDLLVIFRVDFIRVELGLLLAFTGQGLFLVIGFDQGHLSLRALLALDNLHIGILLGNFLRALLVRILSLVLIELRVILFTDHVLAVDGLALRTAILIHVLIGNFINVITDEVHSVLALDAKMDGVALAQDNVQRLLLNLARSERTERKLAVLLVHQHHSATTRLALNNSGLGSKRCLQDKR